MFPRAGGLRFQKCVACTHRTGRHCASRATARRTRRPRPAALASQRRCTGPPAPARLRPCRKRPRQRAAKCYAQSVNALKAHVKNGRIVVDEPTDLPEGTSVHVYLVSDDDESPEERAQIEAEIDAGIAEIKAGQGVDDATVRALIREYR